MEKTFEQFERNLFSYYALTTLWLAVLGAIAFFIGDLYLWYQEGTPFFIPTIMAITIFSLGLREFFKRVPKRFIVTDDGFSFNDDFYSWKQVYSIAYTKDTGKIQLRKINFLTEDKIVTIYPSSLSNGDSISMILSGISSKQGIKTVMDKYYFV